MAPVPQHRTNIYGRLTQLFDVLPIDLVGPYPTTKDSTGFIIIFVEHLKSWPIPKNTKDDSASKFFFEEIFDPLGPSGMIISNTASGFTDRAVEEFLKGSRNYLEDSPLVRPGVQWKTGEHGRHC